MSGPALLPALRVGLRESLTSVMHEARQETPTAVGRQTIGSNIRPISTGHSEKDVNCGLPLPHHRHRRPVKLSGMPGEETAAAKGGASSLVSAATLLHMQYQELVALTDTGSQATTLASPQRDLIAATLDLSFMTPLLATIQACSSEDLPLVPLSPGSRASSPPLGWLPQQHSSPPVRHGSAAAVTASATADTTITNRSPRPVRARRRVFGDAGLPPPLLRDAIESVLRQLPLLRKVPGWALAKLALCTEFCTGSRYSSLYRESEPCEGSLFVLLQGSAALSALDAPRRRVYGVGGVVGTEALLQDKTSGAALLVARLHSCAWLEAGVALCVPCGALWPLPLCPDALHQMNAALYVELLGRHPMFAHLADDALQQAANLLGALKLSRGAKLFRRGERIDQLYFVMLGAVRAAAGVGPRDGGSGGGGGGRGSGDGGHASGPGKLITADMASPHALLGSAPLRLGKRTHHEGVEGAAELSLLLAVPLHMLGRLLRAAPHLRQHVALVRAADAPAVGVYADVQRGQKQHSAVFQECRWTRVIASSPMIAGR
eukprot:Transcript_18706.p1 GENE.Transcript_18706~~Transcript_18706.p1  ORF type:complete len:548 (-),score=79.42 Transcript_18706:65-1708(-)